MLSFLKNTAPTIYLYSKFMRAEPVTAEPEDLASNGRDKTASTAEDPPN